jgi:hypothetical protein
MNHSYLLADIAIEVHAPQLVVIRKEKQVPYPEWLDEGRARAALKTNEAPPQTDEACFGFCL